MGFNSGFKGLKLPLYRVGESFRALEHWGCQNF